MGYWDSFSHGLTHRAGDTTRRRFYDEGNFTSSSQGGAGGGGVSLVLEIFTPDTGYDLPEEFPKDLKDSLMVIFKMQSEREIKESPNTFEGPWRGLKLVSASKNVGR